jgi:hypothetical protein
MRRHLAKFELLPLAAALAAFSLGAACGGTTQAAPASATPPTENGEATVEVVRVDEPPMAEPEPSGPPPITVIAGESTPIDGAMASLMLMAPRAEQVITRGGVTVRVRLNNWPLAADPGNHVHFIVDDEPYFAVRDLSQPVDLAALVRTNLGHELAEGSHVLRMFPSRPQHESVKSAAAFQAVSFAFRTATPGFSFNPSAPLLTYSRPKGCNVLGQRVLLDFFVTNAALSAEGFKVRYAIDDAASGEISRWVPHFIENLPEGEHRLRLTLIGADGQPVAGPFNDTTRTFTVAASCTPAAAPAAAAGSTTAAPAATAAPATAHDGH